MMGAPGAVMIPKPPDELIERARSGDAVALSDLLAVHEQALLRMVELRFERGLRGRLEPADVVQEAMVQATRRFAEWCEQTSFPFHVWLRLLTAQSLAEACRRHIGAEMRDAQREIAFDPIASVSSANAVDFLIASQTSPTQAARRAELCARLLVAIQELEPMDREILSLRHFEGLSNSGAALELGIGPAAASKRYVRALLRLRPALSDLEGTRGG
jgi:RNA polymerase sigma-70 factor (ECF subfamily)